MITLDLHIHSFYSRCSILSFRKIYEECRKKGIGGIAITDHDRIDGAFYFKKNFSIPVIIGEEISTKEGHLIGLFLNRVIPRGMSLKESIDAIKKQGGLVYIPHPLDWTRHGLPWQSIISVWRDIDVIEVFNSRTWLPLIEKKIRALSHKYNLTQIAASDAHSPAEMGKGLIEISRFPQDSPDLLRLLKDSRIIKKEKTPFYQSSFVGHGAKILHFAQQGPNYHQD